MLHIKPSLQLWMGLFLSLSPPGFIGLLHWASSSDPPDKHNLHTTLSVSAPLSADTSVKIYICEIHFCENKRPKIEAIKKSIFMKERLRWL